MRLISELTQKEYDTIIELLKKDNFKISKESNDKKIVFKKELQEFTLYSTDFSDGVNGLTSSVDLEDILFNTYKFKKKHTESLGVAFDASDYAIEEALDMLGWTVNRYYSLKDLSLQSFQEDICFDYVYDVVVRDKKHFIVDDLVYEGDISFIDGIFNATHEDILKKNFNNDEIFRFLLKIS